MPAAAVIPALIAYIKVVAVKKFVVGILFAFFGRDYRKVSYGLGRRSRLPWGAFEPVGRGCS